MNNILSRCLSLVWTSLIITNVVHVAVCGLFGLVFFQGDVSSGQIVVPVRNPTAASARRALTSSFGSVAFGSLIVALVDTLKQALQARANDQQLGFAGQLAAACCACIVNWFEQMLELFNQYAYAHVAIYGKPFCEAARDTWSMIKSKGVTLIINDQLIHSVLAMGAFLVGIICGGVSYSIFLATTINQPDLQGLGVLVFFVGLLIGCVQFHVVCQTVKSGVVSTFVCLAQDAESVKRIKPELYQLMQELYPTIPVFMVVPSAAGFSTIPANPYARYQPPQPQAGMQRW